MGAPELACPVCSKPFLSGSLVLYLEGAFYHLPCRSQALQHVALAEVDRAASARAEAGRLIAGLETRRAARDRRRELARACPLCGEEATVTDWRPSFDWLVIEGCGCRGFFVSGPLFDSRLPDLSEGERQALATRVRWFRRKGAEAWCTTADGTVDGKLDIREHR